MRIQDVQGVIKGIDPRDARKSEAPSERAPQKSTRSDDGDTLDVSLSSRVSELSADLVEIVANQSDNLAVDRANEIQSRINSGYYGQSETTAAIAEHLLNFYGR